MALVKSRFAVEHVAVRHPPYIMEHVSVRIEPMIPADWEQVCAIYEEGIATGPGTFEMQAPSWEEWDAARLPHSRLVAREERVLGWAALSPVLKGVLRRCRRGWGLRSSRGTRSRRRTCPAGRDHPIIGVPRNLDSSGRDNRGKRCQFGSSGNGFRVEGFLVTEYAPSPRQNSHRSKRKSES